MGPGQGPLHCQKLAKHPSPQPAPVSSGLGCGLLTQGPPPEAGRPGLTWPPPAPLSSGWRLSHTWSSTGPPLSWPWTGRAVARLWLPSPPHTAPATGHSRAGPTAVRGPRRSLPGRGGTSRWAQPLGRWEGRPSPHFLDLFISMTLNQISASFRVRAGGVESQRLEVPSQFAYLFPCKNGGGLPKWSSG